MDTPTLLAGSPAVQTIGSTSIATGSFTPTAGALVIVVVTAMKAATPSPGDITISADTFGAEMGPWTEIADLPFNNGSNRFSRVAAFWAIAGSAPAAGTVTAAWASESAARNVIFAFEVATGYHATTPVPANVQTGTGTGASLALTLGADPPDTSVAIGVIASVNDSAGITPGTGFTEVAEQDSGGGGGITNTLQAQYDATAPGTTVDWSGLASVLAGGIGFEIAAAAAGTTGTGTAPLPPLQASGAGAVDIVGQGVVLLPALGAGGAGTVDLEASGAAVLPGLGATGQAELAIAGQGAAQLPALSASGSSGLQEIPGEGQAVLPPLGAGGQAAVDVAGQGVVVLPALGAGGQAAVGLEGTGAVLLPGLGAAGAGLVRVAGQGAALLPALGASGSVLGEADPARSVLADVRHMREIADVVHRQELADVRHLNTVWEA